MERTFTFKAVALLLALFAFGIAGIAKLYTIQTAQGKDLDSRLSTMWERHAPRHAKRGRILCRDGETVIATSTKLARVIVEKHLVADPDGVADTLSSYLGRSRDEVLAAITSETGPRSLELSQNIPAQTAESISSARLRGVFIRYYYQRNYPYGDGFAAQTIGYTCDRSGLSIGLEKQYNDTLEGTDGSAEYDSDRSGRMIPCTLAAEDPQDGADLVTTMDAAIQQICEDVVQEAYKRHNPKWALIAVMDPSTGEILAVASRPGFDPNDYAKNGSQGNEANPLVHFVYEPGSVMKPLIASAALDRGWLTTDETFHCTPTLKIGKYTITEAEHDKNPAGYGDIPINNIIVHSSNVGIAQVGLKLGQEKLSSIFSTFGLYEKTGIELPAEAHGIKPKGYTHARKGEVWPEVVVANSAFGQGIAVTPLQLMRAYAAIANGGFLVRPTLVVNDEELQPQTAVIAGKQVPLKPDEKVMGASDDSLAPEPAPSSDKRRIFSTETANGIQQVLQTVVREGTGKKAALEYFYVAGKTGTAEVPGDSGYKKGKYNSTFIGFFPSYKPRYLILALLSEPRGQYYASQIAAPVFHEVAERITLVKEVRPEISRETGGTP